MGHLREIWPLCPRPGIDGSRSYAFSTRETYGPVSRFKATFKSNFNQHANFEETSDVWKQQFQANVNVSDRLVVRLRVCKCNKNLRYISSLYFFMYNRMETYVTITNPLSYCWHHFKKCITCLLINSAVTRGRCKKGFYRDIFCNFI